MISTLGWSFYLASSWTWCIGMFLPVLLVDDFGVWGWIVFAVPNVVGAAAVGALRSPLRDSVTPADAQGFGRLSLAFSFVTILFHTAFLGWMTPIVFSPFAGNSAQTASGALAVALCVTGAWMVSRLHDTGMLLAAIATYALSLSNHLIGPSRLRFGV